MDFQQVQVGYNKFFVDRRYTQFKVLGDGSYGFVASAVDTISGHKVAIKKIKDTFADLVDAKRILREIKLLRHFNSHENIITMYDIMTVPPNTQNFQDIYIVTNLMESDLERIIRSKQVLTNQHFQYFLYQILRALKYIHSANVLHRDLKPSNLLVNANCDLAVCDFGLSRGFDIEGKDTLTEYVVTRWYRAPELLCNSPHYGKAVDVWSIGCIFAELLTHDAFFQGDSPPHQLEVIVSKIGLPRTAQSLDFIDEKTARNLSKYINRPVPPFASWFPKTASSQALELLSAMLRFNPDERITVEAALEHPYLADFHGQMPEPLAESLFDFEFEKVEKVQYVPSASGNHLKTHVASGDGHYADLTLAEVQAHMYLEMCTFRPEQGKNFVPLAPRGVKLPHNPMGAHRDAKGYKECDDEDGMSTAREDPEDCKMDMDDNRYHK